MIVIDKLTESEIPFVAPLVAQFRVTLKSFRGISSVPNEAGGAAELKEYLDAGFPVYTARADGTYCGYIACRVDEPCVWVESIYVHPDFRRQGIGAALFGKAEELAASFGEDTVYNYVHPNNRAMIAFLREKGYSVLNLLEIRRPYAGEKLTRKIRVDEEQFDY